jgi:hypothetical protein
VAKAHSSPDIQQIGFLRRCGGTGRRELPEAATGGEEQPDRIGPQPTSDKGEYLHRSTVKPVQVINEAAKRLGLGVVRKQAQGR